MNNLPPNPYQDSKYGSFDIVEQHTVCRVLIYSHIADHKAIPGVVDGGRINCSMDVVSCSTSKTIKGGGTAQFILKPLINYLNYIFQDDYVNIYFDPGDGRGFIRTFFGLVDRVERDIDVSADGIQDTKFTISCSDFTKAFDKTHIYFNNHITAQMEDIAWACRELLLRLGTPKFGESNLDRLYQYVFLRTEKDKIDKKLNILGGKNG
jgi:hypothetical protein